MPPFVFLVFLFCRSQPNHIYVVFLASLQMTTTRGRGVQHILVAPPLVFYIFFILIMRISVNFSYDCFITTYSVHNNVAFKSFEHVPSYHS